MKQLLTIMLLFLGLIALSSFDVCAREDYGALLEEDCEVCHIDRYYPGGEFIEAEETYKWQILWVMTAIALLIFAVGMLNTISLWRLGKAKNLQGPVRWGPVFKAFITEVIFEKRIFKTSFIRWSVFFGISMGFIFLLLPYISYWIFRLTSGLDFLEPSFCQLSLDFLMDLFSTLILIGVLLAIVRRYVVKSPQMENLTQDSLAVLLIFLIVVSGFLLEGFRCATLPASRELSFSFMGSIIGSWLRPFDQPWTVYHFYTWLFHAFISLVFIAYIPFGKIRHFIACPVSITATASDEANFNK
jgi:nitrate reductase gamma subunit